MTFPWFSSDVLGWALLHFVWQAVAAAALLRLALLVVPRSRANARYVLACITLAGMAAAPVTTMWAMSRSALLPGAETARGVTLPLEPVGSAPPVFAGVLNNLSSAYVETGALPRGWTSWVVGLWMLGVGVTALRLAGGWWRSQQLLRHDAFKADPVWLRSVERLSIGLG